MLKNFGCKDEFSYPAGTMFMARAELFECVAHMEITKKMFPKKVVSGASGTFAHVMEMVLGGIIVSQGYKIEDVYSFKDENAAKFMNFLREEKEFKESVEKERGRTSVYRMKLFGVPLLKVVEGKELMQFFLFGCLPLLKVKKKLR